MKIINECFLIKWMKLTYEFSTFEIVKDIEKCENFEEELNKFRDIKKMRHMRMPIDWRPNIEGYIRYDESSEFVNGNKLRSY